MINVSVPENDAQLRPSIYVVGVGGAGGNAVNNMIRANLEGVQFIVANTDNQALQGNLAETKVQLGLGTTRGLGAGSRPEVGQAAAEEATEELLDHMQGANMLFITAGMGGGTGTGAAPVIARAAREQGMLTIGVVTKPFHFEGAHRMRTAEAGIKELQAYVDTLIVIPNQNLFRVANEKTTFADAFKMADDVLHSGVRGVTDLMIMPGLINLDFADIKTVMQEMGKAMMGTGEATGDRRALEAAEAAISNPLLEDTSMKGARGILINITGGMDMTLFEVDEAANRIREEVDPEANIIFGSTFDESMDGTMRVSVVATGIDAGEAQQPAPKGLTMIHGGAAKPLAQGAAPVAASAGSATQMPPPVAARASELPPVYASQAATATSLFEAPAIGTARPETAVAAETEEAAQPQPEPVPEHTEDQLTTAAEHGHELAPESVSAAQTYAAPQAPEATAEPDPALAPRIKDAFIPPAPVDPGPKPDLPRHVQPDPFAAAAMENGGQAPGTARKRRLSLFDRMTGLAQNKRQQDETPTPEAATPTAPTLRKPSTLQRPAASTPASSATAQAAAQPTLNIMPAEHHRPSAEEEDMLDIPAFLRRQAN